jgi:hypothetical protein
MNNPCHQHVGCPGKHVQFIRGQVSTAVFFPQLQLQSPVRWLRLLADRWGMSAFSPTCYRCLVACSGYCLPSQIAQAEMPLLQNCSSLGIPSRFAVAPVAMITLCAFTCGRGHPASSQQPPASAVCSGMEHLLGGGIPEHTCTVVLLKCCPPRKSYQATTPVVRAVQGASGACRWSSEAVELFSLDAVQLNHLVFNPAKSDVAKHSCTGKRPHTCISPHQ